MSAAIVKMALKDKNIDFIGFNYGDVVPDLAGYDEIILVDITLPHLAMLGLKDKIVWIDHHISAIRDSENLKYSDIGGVRDTRYAACELTWTYFFPVLKTPEVVTLLGMYDCFRHKGTNDERRVLEFQYGARSEISNLDDAFAVLNVAKGNGDWSMDTDVVSILLERGVAIYRYLRIEAKSIYKGRFETMIDGRYAAVVNRERFNPVNFGIDYHKDGYEVFVCFHYESGMFNYSIYNDNGLVDCSAIAKLYNGGGHKGAAGFRSTELLFK